MTKVIRDAGGRIINIGPWDYQETTTDDGGIIIGNPFPAGAAEADEVVVRGRDGGLYAATDPRKERRTLSERVADLEAKLP